MSEEAIKQFIEDARAASIEAAAKDLQNSATQKGQIHPSLVVAHRLCQNCDLDGSKISSYDGNGAPAGCLTPSHAA
ncbi:hypothetical protein EB235_10755 [Mesorhizobium loti R88b]|uniref:Uncharacterized protein n=1 Tax=Mesorhizobium loti R88b TaxID=935548 RepID=A0A6M7WQ96_RHILI|nr:hypothetical protein EB235_10755 [Mesorhizobium loti R88b]